MKIFSERCNVRRRGRNAWVGMPGKIKEVDHLEELCVFSALRLERIAKKK